MALALVTGPTTGIGRAFGDALARRGLDLVLVSRDAERLALTAAEITATYGVACEVVAADLSVRADIDAVARLLAERPVDVLVNNAGFGLGVGFDRSDVDDEQRLLDVLVTAVMRLTHAAVPGMVERRFGLVVNVGSVAAWIPGGSYSAAKAWVTTMSESLAQSLDGTGVRVVVAAAGFTRTEFHARAGTGAPTVPSWMWLEPAQVAEAALRDAALGRSVSVAGRQYRPMIAMLRNGPAALGRLVTATRNRRRP